MAAGGWRGHVEAAVRECECECEGAGECAGRWCMCCRLGRRLRSGGGSSLAPSCPGSV